MVGLVADDGGNSNDKPCRRIHLWFRMRALHVRAFMTQTQNPPQPLPRSPLLYLLDPPEPTSAEQSPPSASSDPSESQSSLSSYFSDVKQQQQQQHRPASPFSQRNPTIPALSEFRPRSSVPPLSRPNSAHLTTPSSESSSQLISFQELYKRNVTEKADENGTNTASAPGKFGGTGGKHWFEAIREDVRRRRSLAGMAQNEWSGAELMFLESKNKLKLKPSTDPVPVIGGTGTLPVSVFGKERERKDTEGRKWQ
ncbi:uncharacterized protein LOC121248073 [Juglans microcarpa x Juglans regia]|uniref:uncharacterized protein LOC121248073 n=1 Tax=Juglans microcarpa x Juglans regia TaxID=2249226 RepID=UPI001B7F09D6|nr:uncharacterized protein LOC121248073 [Juglans microcarpa x Juglans regia]